VQDLSKFGGDKSKVLLFGESAGAMSVGLHLLSIPSSEGLFETALIESNPLSLPYKSVEQATQPGQCLQEMLGCTDLACMRSKPFEQIVSYQSDSQILLEGLLNGFAGFLVWAPAVDGTLVTQQPFADIASGLPKPTLIGTNLYEGTLFVYSALKALGLTELTGDEYAALLGLLFSPADTLMILQTYPPVSGDNAPVLSQVATDYIFFCSSRHLAAAGVSPVFAYQFTQVSSFNIWPDVPQCADQVCHAAEVPYVFHTASNIGATFTPEALSQAMASYWGGFSRPGSSPNNGGIPGQTGQPFPELQLSLDLGTPISSVVDRRQLQPVGRDRVQNEVSVGAGSPSRRPVPPRRRRRRREISTQGTRPRCMTMSTLLRPRLAVAVRRVLRGALHAGHRATRHVHHRRSGDLLRMGDRLRDLAMVDHRLADAVGGHRRGHRIRRQRSRRRGFAPVAARHDRRAGRCVDRRHRRHAAPVRRRLVDRRAARRVRRRGAGGAPEGGSLDESVTIGFAALKGRLLGFVARSRSRPRW
jgi:hypothetical protein